MDLGQRVTELEEVAARFQATVARLQEEIRKKDKALAAASERIKELEAALGRHSVPASGKLRRSPRESRN